MGTLNNIDELICRKYYENKKFIILADRILVKKYSKELLFNLLIF